MKNYDDTTAFLGQWGRFQQIVFFMLCASIFPNGFGALSVVFVTDIPRHHCLVPEVNLTQDWHNAIIPLEVVNGKQELSRCSRYRLDVVRNLSAQGFIPGRDVNLTDLEQEGCVDGWSYSRDIYQSTIVSEFDLVCSEQWKQPFTSTVFFLGVLFGSFFSGQLSDRAWKSLLLALSVPGLLYPTLWWFIPESPRWLLSQGRVEEAEAIVRKAATKNKVEAPRVIFEDYSAHADETKKHPKEHYNVFSLLRTRNLRNTTVILCLVWFALSIGYFALSLNTSRLHADPYISCFISAAVEVPAYISSWLVMRYLPRRLSAICILLLVGGSLYFIQLVPQSLSNLSVALEMLGKFGITTGTALMFAYTAELYPTVLRNTATGTCTTVSRVGSCISPFLLQLSIYFKYLPYITLGTLAVVSAFATLFLPESFGRPLPETIQQMHKRERWVPSIKCPFITRKEHSKPVVLLESQLLQLT
ncbi:solute carrier family 22 member 5-like isoform X3 [Micropterus salmoides]|uniref:solute carrier family 22 member 5-like isoform X3 n=1 Tax=Micropterus salmoides TaxID=27706 RepID=UPI0018EA6E32|nr:solute carrier family 22 member 5-like isoform X3 [Micropterus salmoides]